MAQNTSVPAFGDNFLARQENHSHYLEPARHLFSLGLGLDCTAYLPSTSTPIPLACDSPATGKLSYLDAGGCGLRVKAEEKARTQARTAV